jgi:hypothetical protein
MATRKLLCAIAAAAMVAFAPACKSKKPTDDFVHVDVYGQMDSRYEPILESRFRTFSRLHAKLPTGRKILVSEVMEGNFYDRLPDPNYRAQAQVIVLNSEQEAAADPSLATEFVHSRKSCSDQIPCYLLIPNTVSGEQREAAQQLLDFVAPAVPTPSSTPASTQSAPPDAPAPAPSTPPSPQ